jgi:acetyl-CoA carboxylase biotin carboxyl carrier protein
MVGPGCDTATPPVRSSQLAPAEAADITTPPGHIIVPAPSMGTFYRAEKPGAPPFVEVGQGVTADTELCLIEVMKLFTTLRAGVCGKVTRILVGDGTPITLGQPLFVVDTNA